MITKKNPLPRVYNKAFLYHTNKKSILDGTKKTTLKYKKPKKAEPEGWIFWLDASHFGFASKGWFPVVVEAEWRLLSWNHRHSLDSPTAKASKNEFYLL
jgi:hypothetical protein